MAVLFDVSSSLDGGELKREFDREMGTYHFLGASRGALLLGATAGYATGAARAVHFLTNSHPVLNLVAAALVIALLMTTWILGFTYRGRRTHWDAAHRIMGVRLSAQLLTPAGTTALLGTAQSARALKGAEANAAM